MAVLGLRFCARAFSSCGKWGPLFIAVRRPLIIVASLVAEHRLQMRRLSNCGSRAHLLCSMWDLPRPGLEPASPALAGRLSTTAPPGKPLTFLHKHPAQSIRANIIIKMYYFTTLVWLKIYKEVVRITNRLDNIDYFWNRREGGRAQPLKEWQSPRTRHKLIRTN